MDVVIKVRSYAIKKKRTVWKMQDRKCRTKLQLEYVGRSMSYGVKDDVDDGMAHHWGAPCTFVPTYRDKRCVV